MFTRLFSQKLSGQALIEKLALLTVFLVLFAIFISAFNVFPENNTNSWQNFAEKINLGSENTGEEIAYFPS
ncbi:MAG: hypothetical protein NUV57_01760, partial [archaeon]|nr:hypothetical protein [archaeon]